MPSPSRTFTGALQAPPDAGTIRAQPVPLGAFGTMPGAGAFRAQPMPLGGPLPPPPSWPLPPGAIPAPAGGSLGAP